MDYMKFVEHHRATGADITIGCLPVGYDRASDFGLMKIDDEGRCGVRGRSMGASGGRTVRAGDGAERFLCVVFGTLWDEFNLRARGTQVRLLDKETRPALLPGLAPQDHRVCGEAQGRGAGEDEGGHHRAG